MVHHDFQLRNSWDYALSFDAFLFGDAMYWIDQNHNYRGHAQALLRYNWSLWANSSFHVDLRHEGWIDSDGRWQQKGKTQWNWILLSRKSVGMLYLEWNYLDQTRFDNESSLIGIGIRILH